MTDHPSQPYAPGVPTAVTDHPSQPYAPPGFPVPVTDTPSQPVNMPREPYSPFRAPSGPAHASAPPRKSRKGVFIALALLAVAAIGVVVAVVVVSGGGSGRSRDEVIKQTFAALAAGDEDKLFELAAPAETFTKIVRCEKKSSDLDLDLPIDSEVERTLREEIDYRDPKKLEERWRKDVKQLLRRTKGAKLEVVDILTEMPPPMGTKPKKSKRDRDRDDDDDDDDDYRDRDRDRYREDDEDRPERDPEFKTTTYRKGQEVMGGCYAKVPFRSQLVKVVIDVKEGEREFTQRLKVMVNEIDGRWYLSSPPSLNVGLDIIVSDLEGWRDKVCKCTDAGCVEDLDSEHRQLSYVQYSLDRKSDLPRDLMTKIEKIQQERRVCEGTARGGPELARYKELKDRVCACTDEDCGRKLELEMMELRRQVEANARRSRGSSYEVTRQVSEISLQASECTRKLALYRPRIYSAYPSSGELTGGLQVTVRGSNFTSTPRTAKVWFGMTEATSVRIVTDRELVVEVPPAEVEGYVAMRVEFTPGGSVTVPYGFTYRAPLKPKPKRKPKPPPTL